MADNLLRKLAARYEKSAPEKKVSKHNRTLALRTDHFLKLQEYCRERGVPVSNVIDDLIEMFLTQAGIILPPPTEDKEAS